MMIGQYIFASVLDLQVVVGTSQQLAGQPRTPVVECHVPAPAA